MSQCSITCRTCGHVFVLPEGEQLRACAACGTVGERPLAEGDALDKLQRAVRLRLKGEYGQAEKCYNAVLAEFEEEHEALWGRLLCHYGVEIVLDEKTGGRYPLVHIPRRTLMQESADFQQACELAPAEIRAQYEQDAAYVDEAQAEIRVLAESCQPYDVFLCHKTTMPDSDVRTEDYDRAFKLYHGLSMQGYRVFFAPMELQGRNGANYEAGIYHALQTAHVMLVICSCQEYLNSTWVQSEWRRYLELMGDERDDTPRTLRPLLYGDMPASKLPLEFRRRKLQAITMADFGADANLMAVLQQFCGVREAPWQGTPAQEEKPAPGPVFAPENHFTADETSAGMVITGYTGPGGEVLIPPTIDGQKVVGIGECAFQDSVMLTRVVIPEGVTFVEQTAFWNCIGLTSLQLPASLRRIEVEAFGSCNALKEILIAEENETFVTRNHVIFTRDGVLVCYPAGRKASAYTIPAGTKEIGGSAFAGSAELTKVNIPDSIVRIGPAAFSSCCGLTGVDIPQGVKGVEDYTFHACSSLASVALPAGLTDIGAHAFAGCRELASLDIPEGVTGIGAMAFCNCSGLKRMTLPVSLTNIDDQAFPFPPFPVFSVHEDSYAHAWAQKGKYAFELIPAPAPASPFVTEAAGKGVRIVSYTGPGGEVDIPAEIDGQRVVEIGDGAFSDCLRLTGVTIPEGVERIGERGFTGCMRMKTVRIPASLSEIGGYAFAFCTALTGLRLPEGLKSIGVGAFSGCSNLMEMSLPASLRSIGAVAFRDCHVLKLRVPENSVAHAIVRESRIPFEVISLPQSYAPERHFSTREAEGGVCITAYRGQSRELFIPPVIGGKPVLEIGEQAFRWSEMTKVVIPEGVKVIRTRAFNGCSSLTEVAIPRSLQRLGENAFEGCSSLAAVHIPAGVTTMGGNPFNRCGALETITVDEENTAFCVWENVLLSRSGKLICCPAGRKDRSCVVPVGVTAIGGYAFDGCSDLRTVQLPEGVKSIGSWAFCGCSSLEAAAIPESLAAIGRYAFFDCSSLAAVHIPAGVTSIGESAFNGCSRLAELELPAGVTAIGESAFAGCDALTLRVHEDSPACRYAQENRLRFEAIAPARSRTEAVLEAPEAAQATESCFRVGTMGDGVAIARYTGPGGEVRIPSTIDGRKVLAIWEKAFYENAELTKVVIPEDVTSIGERAFALCKALTEVSIPGSVTEIGMFAFGSCTGLTGVELPEGVKKIGDYAFAYCAGLKRMRLPASVTDVGVDAFRDCSSLAGVELQEGLMRIGTGAFRGCTSLTEVCVPQSVTSLGNDIFEGCTGLKTAKILADVTGMGGRIFKDCRALTEVKLPAHMTNIGQQTFEGCSSLTGVKIPLGVKLIGDSVFNGCTALTEVSIPASVTDVGTSAFWGCSSLRSVALPVYTENIGSWAFCGCSSLTEVIIPPGVKSIPAGAFENCGSLTQVKLPAAVQHIGERAFAGCQGLTGLELPERLGTIGKESFRGCSSLTEAAIPQNVWSIGADAFEDCPRLTLHVHANSEALRWAKKAKVRFRTKSIFSRLFGG